MKKTTLYSIIILLFVVNTISAQSWKWAKEFGSLSSEKGITVKADSKGNAILTGYFQDTVNMGNGIFLLPLGHQKEIFIAKFDEKGQCLWAKTGDGFYDDRILGSYIDANDNIYITGTCFKNITFGNITLESAVILPNTCCDQCFVFKLSPEGNPIWGTLAGGADDDQGLDIIGDTQGNTYVTGFTNANGSIAFGNNLTITTHNIGTNIYNYFAAKLDQSGVWQWATTFGNLPWDEPTNKYLERDIAISIDDSSNIYIAGGFDGTRNFGTKTLTAAGGTDIFLTKISSAGDIKWAIAGGSHKDDWANGVSADNLGNVYVTGEHRDSLFFGQTLVQNFKKRDAFIAKFDTQNGRCLWGKHAGNDEGNERGNDVFADKNCNVYVTGEVGGNATFGNILVENEGNPQIFVAKISTEGDWIWAATAGSSDTFDIRSNSIAMAQNDEIYITGNFRNTAIFGSNTLASNGKTDVFLAKINDFKLKNNCTIERKTLARAINIYPNPATSFINIAYFANKKENMDIKIIDITGRAVAHWTVTATNGQNNIERDLPILPTAIYYVYITTESIFSIQKLFIQQ